MVKKKTEYENQKEDLKQKKVNERESMRAKIIADRKKAMASGKKNEINVEIVSGIPPELLQAL